MFLNIEIPGKVIKYSFQKFCNMKKSVLYFILSLAFLGPFFVYGQQPEIRKIWDKAPHNAFTDLIRYKSYFYCTFREGVNHVPHDKTENGTIRIIRSKDGNEWNSVASLTSDQYDLRDPKLSITPDNKLMVLMGGSHYRKGENLEKLSHVAFSGNGPDFTQPRPVAIEESVRTQHDWIWRTTWRKNTGYAVVYQTRLPDDTWQTRLLKTKDGISYQHVCELEVGSKPNEATIRFDGEQMFVLVRRANGANGMLGKSRPPYQDWTWHELGFRLGGPNFLFLPDDKLCIGSRHYKDSGAQTALFVTDRQGNLKQTIDLPSGGDTSYPGMLIFNNKLWVSYYSSHEEKTAIYLAKIRMNNLLE